MVAPPAVVLRCARVVTAPMRCEVALGPPRAINAVEQEWPQARAPIFPPSSKSCSSALASSASTSRSSSLRARSSALLRPPNQRSTSRKIQGTKRKYRARRCTVLIPGNGASANATRSAPTPSSSRVSERPSSSTTWQRAPPLGVGEGQPGQRGQGVRKVRDGASGQRKGALRDRHRRFTPDNANRAARLPSRTFACAASYQVHSPATGTAAMRSPNGRVSAPVCSTTPLLKRLPSLSRR